MASALDNTFIAITALALGLIAQRYFSAPITGSIPDKMLSVREAKAMIGEAESIAATDPTAAKAWVSSRLPRPVLDAALGSIAAVEMNTDPLAPVRMAEDRNWKLSIYRMTGDHHFPSFPGVITGSGRWPDYSALASPFGRALKTSLLHLGETTSSADAIVRSAPIPDLVLSGDVVKALVGQWAKRDLDACLAWIARCPPDVYGRVTIADLALAARPSRLTDFSYPPPR